MNKYILVIITLVLGFSTASSHANSDKLDNILALNTRAMGGAENWSKVHNIRVLLTIKEPGFEVQGIYVATRDGSMRIDITADGNRVFAEGLHRGKAWQWRPDTGYEGTNEAAAIALANGIFAPGRFYTLQQAQQLGASFKLLDSSTEQEWHIQGHLPNGSVIDYFVDRKSSENRREVSRRAFHPDVDPTEVEVEGRNSEPVWIDGVLRYRRNVNTNLATGEWLGTSIAESIEHNIDIEDGYFAPQ